MPAVDDDGAGSGGRSPKARIGGNRGEGYDGAVPGLYYRMGCDARVADRWRCGNQPHTMQLVRFKEDQPRRPQFDAAPYDTLTLKYSVERSGQGTLDRRCARRAMRVFHVRCAMVERGHPGYAGWSGCRMGLHPGWKASAFQDAHPTWTPGVHRSRQESKKVKIRSSIQHGRRAQIAWPRPAWIPSFRGDGVRYLGWCSSWRFAGESSRNLSRRSTLSR